MTALVTGDRLLDIVRRSGLVAAGRLAEFAAQPGLVADAAALAAALIAAGLLTPFQAKLLLAGKYRGLVLGSYKILDQIGRGGMGTVYLAEHTSLRRKVAVKVLAGQQATTDEATTQFYREAQAAAALDHPNIVKVYDIGRFGSTHYIAMEYVDGQTLAQLLAAGPVPFEAAADYAAQAAAGLQAAGDRGFVHRDIKPENLIVDRAGTLKILDLGLAHAIDGDRATPDTGSVQGTPDYIAPEQALNGPVDTRTDIYSLGVTLYALLTGRPPFAGTTSQKLLQHQLNAAPPFGDLPTRPPAELERVVAKMMAKRPVDRYQQPADVIDALAPWLSPSALAATQTWSTGATLSRSGTEVLTRPARPPRAWILPAAGVVLAGLVVACVAAAVTLLR